MKEHSRQAGDEALRDAGANPDRHPVLLLIGWDGATPELLERFIRAGKLPTVEGLIRSGSGRRLRSTIPPVTACAWSSFLTGKNPGKHGLFDFVTPREGSYKFAYTHGGYRRDRGGDLLSLLNRAGLRVGCVNVPMTYPPRAIDGFMVSGLDAPDEHSGIAEPAALFEQAQAEVGPYRIDNRHLGSMKGDAGRREAIDEFKRIETLRTDITTAMIRREAVDVLMLVYNATDQVQHHFWHLMDAEAPDHPGPDSREVTLFQDAIQEIYTHCDAELARLLERFPDANVMLLSDHGAGPVCGPRVRLNNVLAEAGLLTWAPTQGTFLADTISRFDEFLRRTLSAKQKARLARWLPAGRTGIESLGLPPVDWAQTTAFAYEGYTLSPCIWINRRDRFPNGTVSPGEEYDRACARITEILTALRDPKTGAQVIPRVYRSDEVYHGEHMAMAPDLILNWWEDPNFMVTKSHPKFGKDPSVFYPRGPAVPGRDITGIHRRDGVLVASGPQLASFDSAERPPADLTDVAPTTLALLGLPVPEDMDGQTLEEIVAGEIPVDRAPRPSPPTDDDGQDTEVEGYGERDAKIIEQRLSDLGYIE